jgi:hypothetical protein
VLQGCIVWNFNFVSNQSKDLKHSSQIHRIYKVISSWVHKLEMPFERNFVSWADKPICSITSRDSTRKYQITYQWRWYQMEIGHGWDLHTWKSAYNSVAATSFIGSILRAVWKILTTEVKGVALQNEMLTIFVWRYRQECLLFLFGTWMK